MKSQEFYQFGQMLRGAVDPLLPEEMRSKPAQPEAPMPDRQPTQMGMQPPPAPSPAGGDEGNEFGYDPRVADRIVQQYVNAGYDPQFAIGMAANAVVESSLSPTAFNEGEGAFGLFQWRNDRLDNLRSFADRAGKSINDINTQIEFSIAEMMGAEKVAYDRITGGGAESSADYARLIDKHWERSSGQARERRAEIASRLYQDYFGEGGRLSGRGGAPDTSGEINAPGAGTYVPQLEDGRGVATLDPNQSADVIGSLFAQPEQPAVDGTVEAATAAPAAAAPAAAAPAAAAPADTGQSPTGGQGMQLGQSAAAGGEGELGGFKEIFMRREGESDASFGDRRRNMFLAAAEGFQMLSRGVKADFLSPVQQRLNEKQRRIDNRYRDVEQVRDQSNADRNYGLQVRQEARLERAQQLAEQQFVMDQAAKVADRERNAQMQQGLAEFYTNNDMPDLAELVVNGQAETANKIYTDRVKPLSAKEGADAFTLSDSAAEAMITRLEGAERSDLAETIKSRKENPRAAYEAFKEAVSLDLGTAEGNAGVLDGMLAAVDNSNLPSATKDNLKNLARTAAATGDSGPISSWFDAYESALDSTSSFNDSAKEVFSIYDERYKQRIGPSTELAEAGRSQMGLATSPNFNPNQLKGQFLSPIARLMRGFPGGDELAQELLGVTDADVFSDKLLTAIKNGQLGNLAQGVTGQLSNLEGDRLLSRLGDGTMERVEIMALGQVMVREREAELRRQQARFAYQQELRSNPDQVFDPMELETRMEKAGRSVELFDKVEGTAGRFELRNNLLAEYAAKQGMTMDELRDLDYGRLPPELAGMVVFDTQKNDYIPLFAELFKEYQQ